MAFTPSTLAVMVDTIAGGNLRIHGYETADSEETVRAAGYFTNAGRYGLREGDLVCVKSSASPGVLGTFFVELASISAAGHGSTGGLGLTGDTGVSALDYYLPTDSGIQQAINRAIDAVAARGSGRGGLVYLPNLGSSYDLTGSIVIKDYVHLVGIGRPRLVQSSGVNKTLIQGEDFLTLSGTNSGAGVEGFAIRNLLLDGNRANNTSAGTNEGHGIAVYGRNFVIEDVYVLGTRRRGIFTEYGDGSVGTSPFNGRIARVTTDTTGEEGWRNKVSDLHAEDINIRSPGQNTDNTFDAIYLDSSGGIRGTKINVWRGGSETNTHRYALNILASATTIEGAHFETAKTASIYIGTNRCMLSDIVSYNMIGSAAFHAIINGNGNQLRMSVQAGGVSGEATTAYGVKLGDTNTVTGNKVDVNMSGHSGGLVNFANTGGANQVVGRIYRPSGGAFYTGTPHGSDRVDINATGDAATEQGGFFKLGGSSGSVTPAGTTQGGATLLLHTVNRVFTTDAGNVAVLLPSAVAGTVVVVANIGSQTISVFPASGQNHQGSSANAADTITAGSRKAYIAHSATEWGSY